MLSPATPADIKPGDRMTLQGKKIKPKDAGKPVVWETKTISKDFGACQPPAKSRPYVRFASAPSTDAAPGPWIASTMQAAIRVNGKLDAHRIKETILQVDQKDRHQHVKAIERGRPARQKSEYQRGASQKLNQRDQNAGDGRRRDAHGRKRSRPPHEGRTGKTFASRGPETRRPQPHEKP